MQLTPKLHVSTSWGHLQAYKICVAQGTFVNVRGPVVLFFQQTKPRDPVGSIYKRTLCDTFYNPEDDPTRSKHVALVLIA